MYVCVKKWRTEYCTWTHTCNNVCRLNSTSVLALSFTGIKRQGNGFQRPSLSFKLFFFFTFGVIIHPSRCSSEYIVAFPVTLRGSLHVQINVSTLSWMQWSLVAASEKSEQALSPSADELYRRVLKVQARFVEGKWSSIEQRGQAMHRWHSCCHGRRRENPWRLAVEEVPKLARKKLTRSQAFHQEQVRRWKFLLSLAVSCQKIQKSNCRAWKRGNVRGEELSIATLQSGQNTSFSSSITASLVSIESLFVRPSSRTLREEARWSRCELEGQEVGLATVWSFLRTQALIMSCIQRDGPPPGPPWSIAQNFLSTRERPCCTSANLPVFSCVGNA